MYQSHPANGVGNKIVIVECSLICNIKRHVLSTTDDLKIHDFTWIATSFSNKATKFLDIIVKK